MDGSITGKMKDPTVEPPSKEAKTFFKRIASLPKWRAQTEFERQNNKESNQNRAREIHTKDLLEIQNLANSMGISMEEAGELYYGMRDFEKATVVYKYERGKPLVTTEQEYRDLPTYMRQLHDYYTIDTSIGDCVYF